MVCTLAFAQKKPLDHSVYDSWQSVVGTALTDDGHVMAYNINPQEGDSELVIVNTVSGQELHVERGGAATLSKDGRWALFTIKAPFADTRKAKIAKKKGDEMPKDSLGLVDLNTFELKKIANVSASKSTLRKHNFIAYQTEWKKEVPDTVKKAPKAEKITVVMNLVTGRTDTLKNVSKYASTSSGPSLPWSSPRTRKTPSPATRWLSTPSAT